MSSNPNGSSPSSNSRRNPLRREDMDALQDLMSRMESTNKVAFEGRSPTRSAFPTTSKRPSSKSSSTRSLRQQAAEDAGTSANASRPPLPTRLSSSSSSRSIASNTSMHAYSNSHISHQRSATAGSNISRHTHDGDDQQEKTPSATQGEWTPLANRASRDQLGVSTSAAIPSSSIGRSHSPSASLSSISVASGSSSASSQQPRLMPRSPLNDRAPLEDLAFFKQMGMTADDSPVTSPVVYYTEQSSPSQQPQHSVPSTSTVPSDPTSSVAPSTPSSVRNQRLREEIERTAERYRWLGMSSSGGSGSLGATGERPSLDATASTSSLGTNTSESFSSSSVPLYPGAPSPQIGVNNNSRRGTVTTLVNEDNSASPDKASLASGLSTHAHTRSSSSDMPASLRSMFPTQASTSPMLPPRPSTSSGTSSFGRRGESPSFNSGASSSSAIPKPRQRELQEWNYPCWIWQREKSGSSGPSVSGVLQRANKIGEVPAAMKRKMTKRDSHQLLTPTEALMFGVDERGKEKDRDKDLSKEKIRSFANGLDGGKKDGSWKKASGALREDGIMHIYSDDKVLLRTINLRTTARTDIRLVDASLYGVPNCVSIRGKTSAGTSFSPSSPLFGRSSSIGLGLSSSASSPHSNRYGLGHGSNNAGSSEETLYLRMPSVTAAQVWYVMAQCYAYSDSFTEHVANSRSTREPSGLSIGERDDDEAEAHESNTPNIDKMSCRIFRSIVLSINEGRAIGEPGTEVLRPTPGTERDAMSEKSLHADSTTSLPTKGSASSTISSIQRLPVRSNHGAKDEKDGEQPLDTFCEVVLDGEVVARTSVKKSSSSPFWNETFTLENLPNFLEPMLIRVFQTRKHARPTLVGTATVRIADLPRGELVENWWCLKPSTSETRGSRASETVGELNLGLRVGEEVVLPSEEYRALLEHLVDDDDCDLATDIASEFPADLEEVTNILLRIYISQELLVTRILKLADLEVERSAQSAAILFRGNSILTKIVEMYMRKIGGEYLDLSIGEPVRRLCADKVEIEIDPSRMKQGTKDKELQSNVNELLQWSMTMWNSIYEARERCPHDLRHVFSHIQKIASERYGEESNKTTRWTSVSAFIFLRFFVPAVLNPKLFGLVSAPPDPKSQRTLTLIAKTLQGLANFSTFGQKEGWMLCMNEFVQDHTSGFVDFIEHIATEAPPSNVAVRQEWTSPTAPIYLAPNRLRSNLPQQAREGVPTLPHLIDLPRNLGLLATNITRNASERAQHVLLEEGRGQAPSITSRSTARSSGFASFVETCADTHEESRRRGGGLFMPIFPHPSTKADVKSRARLAIIKHDPLSAPLPASPLPIRPRSPVRAAATRDPVTPPPRRTQAPIGRSAREEKIEDDVAEIHIRAKKKTSFDMPIARSTPTTPDPEEAASRRNHRSFTINSRSPQASGPLLESLDTLTTEELNFAKSRGIALTDLVDGSRKPTEDSVEATKVDDGEAPPAPPKVAAPSEKAPSYKTHSTHCSNSNTVSSVDGSHIALVSAGLEDDILDSYAFPHQPAKSPVEVKSTTKTTWTNAALAPFSSANPAQAQVSTANAKSSKDYGLPKSSTSPSLSKALLSFGGSDQASQSASKSIRDSQAHGLSIDEQPFSFGSGSIPMQQSRSTQSIQSSSTSELSVGEAVSMQRRGSLGGEIGIEGGKTGKRKKSFWGYGSKK